jgi:hypothetical protein
MAALHQQIASSNTHLQQQREATAAAQVQAAAATFGRVKLEAQLRSTQHQQHSLQQELKQARLEREQATATMQDLSTQLHQANRARVAAEQALAAERAQHSMTVVAGAADKHALVELDDGEGVDQGAVDCFVEVGLLPAGADTPCRDSSTAGSKAASPKPITAAHPAVVVSGQQPQQQAAAASQVTVDAQPAGAAGRKQRAAAGAPTRAVRAGAAVVARWVKRLVRPCGAV